MFLSELTNKEIFVGKNPRGIVKGVAISLKTHEVKYLLCANAKTSRAIFAVPIRAVVSVDERIYLSRLRPVLPKHCACIFLQLPVYSFEGEHLGALQELSLQSFVATTLFTDKNISFPVSAILACSDAVLLKKEQPYPLGQRIPALSVSWKCRSKAHFRPSRKQSNRHSLRCTIHPRSYRILRRGNSPKRI